MKVRQFERRPIWNIIGNNLSGSIRNFFSISQLTKSSDPNVCFARVFDVYILINFTRKSPMMCKKLISFFMINSMNNKRCKINYSATQAFNDRIDVAMFEIWFDFTMAPLLSPFQCVWSVLYDKSKSCKPSAKKKIEQLFFSALVFLKVTSNCIVYLNLNLYALKSQKLKSATLEKLISFYISFVKQNKPTLLWQWLFIHLSVPFAVAL